ncbi:hypothetical protein LCGC14_1879950, partial [marine sediment metagenome]
FKEDFRNIQEFHCYDSIIALEIFEHINWDIEFIDKINRGTWVFFSVPNKMANFHVRYFVNKEEIIKRYSKLLEIKDIEFIPSKWWVVAAKRK